MKVLLSFSLPENMEPPDLVGLIKKAFETSAAPGASMHVRTSMVVSQIDTIWVILGTERHRDRLTDFGAGFYLSYEEAQKAQEALQKSSPDWFWKIQKLSTQD